MSWAFLFQEYLERCNQAVDQLQLEFGVDDVRHPLRFGIPLIGTLKGFGGGTYTFHGIGCRIEAKELDIDWDLVGSSLVVNSFDPWKVYWHAKCHPVYSTEVVSEEWCEVEIESMERHGVIVRNEDGTGEWKLKKEDSI